jgi:hypothetical protein
MILKGLGIFFSKVCLEVSQSEHKMIPHPHLTHRTNVFKWMLGCSLQYIILIYSTNGAGTVLVLQLHVPANCNPVLSHMALHINSKNLIFLLEIY